MRCAGLCVCFVEILNVSSKPKGFRPSRITTDMIHNFVAQGNGKYKIKLAFKPVT
jgi:hypothetical protein